MKTLVSLSILLIAIFAFGGTANIRKGVMLYGYDPVSYYTSEKPVKGSEKIKAEVNGLTYLFSTEANKKLFLAAPKQYEPQYEGWCATAVGKGYKYDIDPENFKVTNGKLYLFYKGWNGDAKKDWVVSEPDSIKKANTNWPQVKNTEE